MFFNVNMNVFEWVKKWIVTFLILCDHRIKILDWKIKLTFLFPEENTFVDAKIWFVTTSHLFDSTTASVCSGHNLFHTLSSVATETSSQASDTFSTTCFKL